MRPQIAQTTPLPWPRTVAAAFLALCLTVTLHRVASSADPVFPIINEFVANHATPDLVNDHEYIEVAGAPDTSYADLMILVIEGDFPIGTIDAIFSVATTNSDGYWVTGFLPEDSLENGTMTLLLVSGFTGGEGQDLDTNDDGTLDIKPWTELVDAVGVSDGYYKDRTYAATVLPHSFGGNETAPAPGGASRIPDSRDTDTLADWTLNDFDLAGIPGFAGTLVAGEALNTPGARNDLPIRLAVVRAGPGAGSVLSDPGGLNCGAICAASFSAYEPVTLTATAQAGSTFAGWSAPCTGAGLCTFLLTQPMTVTATFTRAVYPLTVSRSGSGTITSVPAGIACGADCNHTYSHGTVVNLTATPDPGWTFTGWGGACLGTGACSVTMTAARTVSATFTRNSYSLTVNHTGSGTITSVPAGIACGVDCNHTYNHGTVVNLIATPDPGWIFAGWGGACTDGGACIVNMTAAKTVTAAFTLNLYALTVSKAGNGTVNSNPAGITCGTDCMEIYDHGTLVTLTATPDPGWTSTGWSTGCDGTGVCSITLDEAKTVTATFTLNTYPLTVNKTGGGTITSNPTGITCGADCTQTYAHGTVVTLTATADPGWIFVLGWSGACSGAATCNVTMDGVKTVTAAFTLHTVEEKPYDLYLPALRR